MKTRLGETNRATARSEAARNRTAHMRRGMIAKVRHGDTAEPAEPATVLVVVQVIYFPLMPFLFLLYK
jgi:hypothetical protein